MLLSLPRKQLDSGLKIKINGKRLYETVSVKNLETQIDKRLTWKQAIIYVILKLKPVFTVKTETCIGYQNLEVSL